MSTAENDVKALQPYEADFPDLTLHPEFQNFYDAQSELVEAYRDYAHQPGIDTRTHTKAARANAVTNFQNVVDEVLNGEVTDEKIGDLHTLMYFADENWVKSIQQITANKNIYSCDSNGLLTRLTGIQEISDTLDEFIERVTEAYALKLKHDMKIASDKIMKKYLAKIANTITISLTPTDMPQTEGASETWLAFAIEPKLPVVHTPDFIPNAVITFSGKSATYGYVQINQTALEGEEPDETVQRTQLQLIKDFDRALNPFDEFNLQLVGDVWPKNTKAE